MSTQLDPAYLQPSTKNVLPKKVDIETMFTLSKLCMWVTFGKKAQLAVFREVFWFPAPSSNVCQMAGEGFGKRIGEKYHQKHLQTIVT